MTSPTLPPRTWPNDKNAGRVIADYRHDLDRPGLIIFRFLSSTAGPAIAWPDLEKYTRSRAITVADISGDVAVPAVEIALCSDLVYLREGSTLLLPEPADAPTAGLTWAFGRAGRKALFRGLLGGGPMPADLALELGLAQSILADDAKLPLPEPASIPALTAARDLLRSGDQRAKPALELATFRYLFATGHPEEGAQAFLERRDPKFG